MLRGGGGERFPPTFLQIKSIVYSKMKCWWSLICRPYVHMGKRMKSVMVNYKKFGNAGQIIILKFSYVFLLDIPPGHTKSGCHSYDKGAPEISASCIWSAGI